MARTKQTARKNAPPQATRAMADYYSCGSNAVAITGGGNRRSTYGCGIKSTVDLREIRQYQKSYKLLIMRKSFQRLVRETLEDVRGVNVSVNR
jgi:hypothetical protein